MQGFCFLWVECLAKSSMLICRTPSVGKHHVNGDVTSIRNADFSLRFVSKPMAFKTLRTLSNKMWLYRDHHHISVTCELWRCKGEA